MSLNNISKSFNGKEILKNIDLNIKQENFISIFGPNATGKTTLLNIISGLLQADNGAVVWENEFYKNRVSYVFQNYRETLFPWKRVWENISLPLKLQNVKSAECKDRATDLLGKFAINIDLEKYPYQLSGGQQQLVAILRAIITDPVLLLLDEPFSALDFAKKFELQQKILEIWHEIKATIIFVSHDLDEAIYLADEVVLLGGTPTGIISNVKVEIDRPRTPGDLLSKEFVSYKRLMLDNFLSTQNIML
ncbi:ABC transporter ATP-binding protein [Mucilaginibacter terrigena]|nr:ABC transporter ATP-binding protein [Mucilaginibacter terrigena]